MKQPWKTMKPPWKTIETNQKKFNRPVMEVIIFRYRQTHMHHNIYIVNIVITIIMLVNMINVIITTVASKAYGGINPKILKIYLISTVVEVTMNMAEYY